MANAETSTIEGIGTVKFERDDGRTTILNETLHVPDLRSNLMSVGKITNKGYSVTFQKKSAVILNQSNEVVVTAKRSGNLYYVNTLTDSANFTNSGKNPDLKMWHERLGHLNERDLKDLAKKQLVLGLKINSNEKLPTCETCIKGKHAQTPFPKVSKTRSSKLLELVHSDVCGPMRTKSIGGAQYFVTFIDDMSRWGEVYFLKQKGDIFEAFKKFKAAAETKTGTKIKVLRSDNGKEYCNKEFDRYLEENGIRRNLTVQYTPQQNGVAERRNRTLVEMARCSMLGSNLPQSFWGEAVAANHIRNRCPSRSLQGKTPCEIWNGRKANVSHFRTFGIKAYALSKNGRNGKFEAKSDECIFVGYCDESKAFRLWDPKIRKIIKSRDVHFIEDEIERKFEKFEIPENETETFEFEPRKSIPQSDSGILDSGGADNSIDFDTDQTTTSDVASVRNNPKLRRSGRPALERTGKRGRPRKIFKTVKILDENEVTENAEKVNLVCHDDPKTAKEALNGINSDEWRNALQSEYNALIKNKTWEVTDRPKDRKVIGSRWVLKTKYRADGTIEKRKARLVAKGFTQRYGIDYQKTFAPVARASSIRLIMALAAKYDLIVHHMDVITAYLNGELDENIYMEKPEMLNELLGVEDDKVLLLKKAIYGLKQSGRQWYRKLDEKLRKYGLKPLMTEPCVYFMRNKNETIIISVYVDDLIIAASNPRLMENIKKGLMKEFEMKDLGPISYCLGVQFKQDLKKGTITMCQSKYTEDILKRFNMEDCKTIATPLDANSKLKRPEIPLADRKREVTDFPYQSLIGSLMYLSVFTRPDISYAVSSLSQFNSDFDSSHINAGKRVLRYLQGSKDIGLKFSKSHDKLVGYVDADWAGDVNDRHSHTGYFFKLSGAAVCWEARKQKSVALSSTEAEYMALSDSSREAIYLRNFLNELGFIGKDPIIINNDNQSAAKLVRNPTFHSRTKHIDARYHYVREASENGLIEVRYLPTNNMIADILTKGLFRPKHLKFINEMGLDLVN